MQTTDETLAKAIEKASWRERANSELQKIVQLFSSTQLPDLCAKALIVAPEKPSSKWSFGNQLLVLLAGTSDARGYRQWQEVNRHVRQGSKAFHILGPVIIKKQVDSDQYKEAKDPEQVLVGFRTIPVFRYEDTEGAELPTYTSRDPPPLMHVAATFGMQVTYESLAANMYGVTDHTAKTITLATEDWDVFFHELAHSIHRSFEPKTGHDQEPEAETIAQLVAATLARLYGRPADSFSWTYIAFQASSSSPQQVGRLCMRVLERARKVLELIYSAPGDPASVGQDSPKSPAPPDAAFVIAIVILRIREKRPRAEGPALPEVQSARPPQDPLREERLRREDEVVPTLLGLHGVRVTEPREDFQLQARCSSPQVPFRIV